MRARIDITEIEAQTKIRAKYLRALENEEWDLLPGPTYVKTFLRTYAEALGLDGRMLVEEYKLRHERLSDVELQPISPPRRDATGGGAAAGRAPGCPRFGLIVGWCSWRSSPRCSRSGGARTTTIPRPAARRRPTQAQRPSAAGRGDLHDAQRSPRPRGCGSPPRGRSSCACMAADGRILVDNRTLQAGQATRDVPVEAASGCASATGRCACG